MQEIGYDVSEISQSNTTHNKPHSDSREAMNLLRKSTPDQGEDATRSKTSLLNAESQPQRHFLNKL